MIGSLKLHVIEPRGGVFSYVGNIPMALAEMVPATTADVCAGRAHRNPKDGMIYAPKFPTFGSRKAAIEFADANGFEVAEK